MRIRALLTAAILCGMLFTAWAALPPPQVIEMGEASAFEFRNAPFTRGQRGEGGYEKPESPAKVYPSLTSGKPIYGSVAFGQSPQDPDPPARHFVVDESMGAGKGYDVMYLDRDLDGDLTNDTPLKALQSPPPGALMGHSHLEQERCFDYFQLTSKTDGEKAFSIEVMPRLAIYEGDYPSVTFVATKVRRGELKVAGKRFTAVLGRGYALGGTLDQGSAVLVLTPEGNGPESSWWGADTLGAYRKFGEHLYEFSATPAGDRLTVKPYAGDYGELRVGAGKREITELGVSGSLRSANARAVAVGEMERGWPKPTKACRVPVGDYLPSYLNITLGKLRISISDNYHADGTPRGGTQGEKVYGFKIRNDEPFVLDFGNEPDVVFAAPARDHRVRRGEKMEVSAVLVDPEFDIMIRGLDDTSQKVDQEQAGPDGETFSYQRDRSLDPKVIITRADGERVVEGVMPFG